MYAFSCGPCPGVAPTFLSLSILYAYRVLFLSPGHVCPCARPCPGVPYRVATEKKKKKNLHPYVYCVYLVHMAEGVEKKQEGGEIRKQIDLSLETVAKIKVKADAAHMKVKQYIEKVIIDHAHHPFKK